MQKTSQFIRFSTVSDFKSLVFLLVLVSFIFINGCSHFSNENQNKMGNGVWENSLKGEYVGKSELSSAVMGIVYPYHIYLPASYQQNVDKNYPIIYALDGQWNFKTIVNHIEQQNLEVILVAIEEGPLGSDRRAIDYRLPGAITYLDFFRQEFMPLIESSYRINANNRSFQGASLGGLAATVFMLLDDHQQPLFKNYIVNDAPYWDQAELMQNLIEKRLLIENKIDSNFYITSAFPLGNHLTVINFIESMEKRSIPNLTIHHEWYMVHHDNILNASLEDTLKLISEK